MKSILFILVLIFLIIPVNAVDWHDDTRLKRVQLNINNSSVALTDYQIIKTVAYDTDMQSDFDDLLFYNESGGSVPYWIESKTDSNTADVWLKIPSISTTEGSNVWMYYNNSSVGSGSSISEVGITPSDHFDDADYTVWTKDGGAYTVTESGTEIFMQFALLTILYQNQASSNYTIETKLKFINTNTGVIFKSVDGSTWYMVRFRAADSKMEIYEYPSSTTHNISTETFLLNTYYKLVLEVVGTIYTVSMYDMSGSLLDTISANDSTHSGIKVGYGGNSNGVISDWIFTRQYTATEPTWLTDGEEESYETPPTLNGTFLYPNSTYSVGCYGKLISELVYGTGFNISDISSCNTLTTGDMEVLSVDDTNYIPSIDKDAAHDGYMYGNFSLPNVESVNFINVKTVHNRNETNPIILGLFNTSTQKWHAVNNSSVEIVDVELTYNITGIDIAKYTTLTNNVLNLSVSLNTNGDGNYDVFVDFVEVYIDYEEAPDITLEYVYNLTISNQNDISILQNDVDDLGNNVNNLYMFVLLCTVFLVVALRKRGDQ